MTHLLLFLALSALAIFLLGYPFLRRRGAPARDAFDLAVYRDQLAELERDHERGLIDAEATRAARLEIERRILAIAGDAGSSGSAAQGQPSAGGSGGRWLAAGLVVVVPLAAGLLYVQLGEPELRDLPLAARRRRRSSWPSATRCSPTSGSSNSIWRPPPTMPVSGRCSAGRG
ncbi:MAG: c-type cytochrome biogenesis protein CcmI [Rhizobiales bacterium]|nr:c-type cytochrome biogenesis protein CcmI [Hyphomicrobiales bacterium]